MRKKGICKDKDIFWRRFSLYLGKKDVFFRWIDQTVASSLSEYKFDFWKDKYEREFFWLNYFFLNKGQINAPLAKSILKKFLYNFLQKMKKQRKRKFKNYRWGRFRWRLSKPQHWDQQFFQWKYGWIVEILLTVWQIDLHLACQGS